MGLQLFNTLTRSIQPFVPGDPAGRRVGFYCCGPTVYDYAHIGNFRTFVFADLLRRYLEFRGYEVVHVMNVTDVEDKIIRRVRETGVTLTDYTRGFEAAFLEDFLALGCLRPTHLPRATEHIGEIIQLIRQLVDRGIAYVAPDGSVYFSIAKYQGLGCHYGRLTQLNFDEMRPGDRVRNDEYAKESIADFALWKARVPEDGAVFWPSPWGEGRPGWHIECSAMSMKILGSSFDLHLGGEDLIFPHHEDEIAQSEGAGLQPEGQPFVRCWVHGAHLLVEGRKMSKSLGNYFTVRDLLARGFLGREIRYALISAHYRETFNFTLESLQGARTALGRIDECLLKLRELAGPQSAPLTDPGAQPNTALVPRFTAAMDADLNVSAAWATVFDWVRDTNRALAQNQVTATAAAAALADWQHVNQVLGIAQPAAAGRTFSSGSAAEGDGTSIPAEILALLEQRQQARAARDFARADQFRQQLKSQGWLIEDTTKGPRLKPV